MVGRIEPPFISTDVVETYNENKMSLDGESIMSEEEALEADQSESGHVVATRNVPDGSTLREEFRRLRELNIRKTRGRKMEKPTFHMSVNPGENDKPLSEEETVRFIDEVMNGLGYGQSPYRIYKHTDIKRVHYHVVTTRIGQDGKKIDDYLEHRRLMSIMKKLEKKYGYTVGKDTEEKTTEKTEETSTDTVGNSEISTKAAKPTEARQQQYVPPFNLLSRKPFTEQFRDIHRDAMKWSFSTPEQYQALLRRRYNCITKIYNENIYYQGPNPTDIAQTHLINEGQIGTNSYEEVIRRCAEFDIKKRKEQKKNLEKLIFWASKNTKDFEDFRDTIERKGVYMVISWTEEGKPFGVTWLDRRTKCAFKGSETETDIAWLSRLAEEKQWKITRHPKYEKSRKPTEPVKTPVKTELESRKRPTVDPAKKQNQKQTPVRTVRGSNGPIISGGHDQDAHTDDNGDGIYEDEAKKIFNQIK